MRPARRVPRPSDGSPSPVLSRILFRVLPLSLAVGIGAGVVGSCGEPAPPVEREAETSSPTEPATASPAGSPGRSSGGAAAENAPDAPPSPPDWTAVAAAETVLGELEQRTAAVLAEPRSGAAWLRLGMVYDAHQLFHLAEACYAPAARLGADEPRAWYHLARVRAELGDVAGALEHVERAIELAPDYGPARWRRGFWLLDLGRTDQARASFLEALELDPADPAGSIGLARAQLEDGDGAAAAETLEWLLRGQPDNGYARQLLGSAYRLLGRLEDAERELAASQHERPAWYDPWRAEVEREGLSLLARLDEARAEIREGRGAATIDELTRLLETHPGDIAVLSTLVPALVQAERVDDAVRVCEEALAARPDHYRIHQNLALLLPLRGDTDRALEHASRAAELNPVFGEAHAQRGRLLLELGRPAEALESLQLAREHADERPEVQLDLARALVAVERWAPARDALEDLVRSSPAGSEAFALLARARAELGELDKAWDAWREARRRGHDRDELDELAGRIEEIEG